jgi:hypothetical protein
LSPAQRFAAILAMNRLSPHLLLLLFLTSAFCSAAAALHPALQAAASREWEQDIAALEALDQTELHPADSILFVGSSSIRLWDTIARDIAPYHPIRRAYGGAKSSDLAVFVRRLIAPHQFRALVIFVANDVTGSDEDATPEQVTTWFNHFVGTAQDIAPAVPIFWIAVTPTPARWDAWPKIRQVNAALARACAAHHDVHFIPTAYAYLDEQGQPHPDLFQDDRLHLNELGYRIWSAIILSHLDAQLQDQTSTTPLSP